MRNTFINELVLLARERSNVILMVGDLGYSVVEPFAEEFPNQFINAGVAEQNMMSMAAGIASEGYHVFVYSIANFPTFRCAEQIRNDVAYHKLPVTVVSIGGGLAYGNLGYSHHAVQDYALMRVLPNLCIAAPGDPMEVSACMRYLINNPQPSYLRLGKSGEPCFHAQPPQIKPGQWLKVIDKSKNRVILSTGAALQLAMEWAKLDEYKDFDICSLPLWSMAEKLSQSRFLHDYEEIITIEDHLSDGGFGSWLLESQALLGLSGKVKLLALSSAVCGTVGSQSTLNKFGGISP